MSPIPSAMFGVRIGPTSHDRRRPRYRTEWALSAERATAAGTGACRAAEAVRARRDRAVGELVAGRDRPDRRARTPGERQLEHLVEVAVVERAVPPDADERP